MSIRGLQSGGTFKNVLARNVDDVVIPILAAIIAFLDCNCNLSLFKGKDITPISVLWLKIFQSRVAEEKLNYDQMVGTQKIIIAIEEFECKFPFFWLVKEAIDMQWAGAKGIAGNCYQLTVFP